MIASQRKLFFTLGYVVTVHIVDLSLYYNDIDYFLSSTGIDFYKLIFWLGVPLVFSIQSFDKAFFSFKRAEKLDYILLSLILLAGVCSMLVIPHIEVLKDYYVIKTSMSHGERLRYFSYQMCWVFSWLIGWEFIHRYFLIKSINKKKAYQALWILPVIEGLYHINKPWPEMMAVFIFSWILTWWTLRRSNTLFPLLAHLIIEIELIFFQLFFFLS